MIPFGQVPPHSARILVIGAGIAGLSAAEHLIRNGFKNISVLEAMDRLDLMWLITMAMAQ